MVTERSNAYLDVVFASDSNYIRYTVVTLASVLKNYSGSLKVRVFLLLDKKLSKEEKQAFDELLSLHNYELHQIEVDAAQFKGIKTTEGISIATYYRLLMHHLLPKDCERVVYLDSDLLVLKSLDNILDNADAQTLFCGVEDSISRDYNKRGGMRDGSPHVNAGVLLVNLKKMRSIPFDNIVSNYIEKNRYRIFLGDQQIIAEAFPEDISYLPVEWNVHGPMFNEGWAKLNCGIINNHSAAAIRDAVDNPAIIHYTLSRKPWMSLAHSRSLLWFEYLNLTAYRNEIALPKAEDTEARPVASDLATSAPSSQRTIGRIIKKVIPGWLKSVSELRQTRLTVSRLEKDILALASQPETAKNLPPTAGQFSGLPKTVILKQYLTSMARNCTDNFVAQDFVKACPSESTVLSNIERTNIDGGYAEFIKQVLRTNIIGQKDGADLVFLLSQRLDQAAFWKCVETAYLKDLPILFGEVALFAGFASFFDADASLAERRVLGFMLDDMGYYFDCHQPSRIEHELNKSNFSLTAVERSEARKLIKKICMNGITKYNKYAYAKHNFKIQNDCVLIIDQKRGDASIEFAGANDESFKLMMEAAIVENPGKQIYFKRHPDSILRNWNSYRNRNIKEIKVLPDNVPIMDVLNRCHSVYTVSSQVGFEALMRKKKVVCFGTPFYAGWGLTDDRLPSPRRKRKRTIEDLFYQSCIKQSVYIDPDNGEVTSLASTIDTILKMREKNGSLI